MIILFGTMSPGNAVSRQKHCCMLQNLQNLAGIRRSHVVKRTSVAHDRAVLLLAAVQHLVKLCIESSEYQYRHHGPKKD